VPFVRGCGFEPILSDSFVTTPSCSFYAKEVGCLGALVITASHNPYNWLGLKIKSFYGCSVDESFTSEIEKRLMLGNSIEKIDGDNQLVDIKKFHLDKIKSIIFVVLTSRNKLHPSFKLILSIESNKILITSISGQFVSYPINSIPLCSFSCNLNEFLLCFLSKTIPLVNNLIGLFLFINLVHDNLTIDVVISGLRHNELLLTIPTT